MDDMTEPVDLTLLDRYLLGECSSAEQDRVRQWMATSPDAADILATLARGGQRAARPMYHGEIDAGWQRMKRAMTEMSEAGHASQTVPAARKRPALRFMTSSEIRMPRWMRWSVAAASFAVAVMLTIAVPYLLKRSAEQPEVSYSTQAGERIEVTLSDGSQVTLGPASQLHVAAGFGRHARVVELVGQAYFDVVHDSARPFSVRSGGMLIEDIGTKFGVRSYCGDSAVRVAVAHGSVAVVDSASRSLRTSTALVAGDIGRFNASATNIVHHGNIKTELGWMSGDMVFTNAPLREILTDLERMYGFETRPISRALGDRRLTFDVHRDSIDELLHLLSQLTATKVERQGRTVQFLEATKNARQ
jgi:ferric-dicitrate binding protein FerR (iron transport regulator)